MERGRKEGEKEGRKVSGGWSKATLVLKQSLQVPSCAHSPAPHWNFLLKILKGNTFRT